MRRRKWRWVVAGLVALVAVGTFAMRPRADPLTREKCGRIKVGMSPVEVETILGPPGDYRAGLGEILSPYGDGGVADPDPYDQGPTWQDVPVQSDDGGKVVKMGTWISDSLYVEIVVDETEHVQLANVFDRRKTQGGFDSLLWRAKRQWRRWFP